MNHQSTRNPINQNQLQSTKFQMIFPRISTTEYFCQSINLPGLSTNPAIQNTPFTTIYRPGDKTVFNILTMNFIIDEDLWSWELIHDWIRCYSFPIDFNEYKELKSLSQISELSDRPQYTDGELNILTALNNVKMKVIFKDLFPISISDVVFETTSSAEKAIIATANFKYQYYTIKRL